LAPQFVLGEWENKLYVCGLAERLQNSPKTLPEMWRCDTRAMQWWRLGFVDETPCGSPEGDYRSIYFPDNRFVVFGLSKSKSIVISSLYIYNILNNTWNIKTTRITPPPRRDHSFSLYNRSTAFLFGGGTQDPHEHKVLNDLWMLRYEVDQTLEWILIHGTSTERHYPSARARQAMVVISTRMYVFGGSDRVGQTFNDLWQYDVLRNVWKVIEAVTTKPVIHSFYWRPLAVTVGNQMVLTLGCNGVTDNCKIKKPQETWLYCPENNRWLKISSTDTLSTIFGARTRPSTPIIYNQGLLILVNVNPGIDRALIHYMTLSCPRGYYSKNITSKPCQPCPIGKYASKQRDNCLDCPDKLTTASSGMYALYQCNQCLKDHCIYGKCDATNRSHVLQPNCECSFGFTGDRCQYPTYYLISIGIVIVATAAVLSVVYLVNIARRKQKRERNLKNQVEELLNAWQIGHEEVTLLETVGSGASGKVYRSVYREMLVAVKIFNMTDDLDSNSEFAREIRFMQTIRHPNVVLFIGAGRTAAESPFLVTEFMARGSLRDVLDNRSVILTLSRKLQFAIGAATGLNFLHTLKPPRIHRDVKSANLLVSDEWMVKVADFGLGRQLMPATKRESNKYRLSPGSLLNPLLGDEIESSNQIGTARWRAPEISRGRIYNQTVDIYRYVCVCVCVCPL
jgi:hypothetical protein